MAIVNIKASASIAAVLGVLPAAAVVCMFFLSQFVADLTGFDLLARLGNVSEMSLHKQQFIDLLIAAGVFVQIAMLMVIVWRQHRPRVLLTLILTVPIYLALHQVVQATYIARPTSIPAALNRILVTENVPPPALAPEKKALIRNFDDFFQAVDFEYQSFAKNYSGEWGVDDREVLRGLYYMTSVAALLPFGDAKAVDYAGCVLTKAKTVNSDITVADFNIRTYLDSPFGCCSDYALLLNALLRRAKINSRVVTLPDHVAVEISTASGPWTLDATYHIAFSRSFGEVLPGNRLVNIVKFNHPGLDASNQIFYRPHVHWQRITLMLAANRVDPIATGTFDTVPGYENVSFAYGL